MFFNEEAATSAVITVPCCFITGRCAETTTSPSSFTDFCKEMVPKSPKEGVRTFSLYSKWVILITEGLPWALSGSSK